MWIQEGDGYAKFRMNFRYRELYISYYTVKTRTITLDIAYLLRCIKPTGDPMGHFQNTDLTTRGPDQGITAASQDSGRRCDQTLDSTLTGHIVIALLTCCCGNKSEHV